MKNRRGRKSGFTLIELMVVIVILGIIGTIAFVYLLDNPDKARWTKAQTEMGEIVKALNNYSLENNGDYPTGLDAIADKFNGKVPLNPFTQQPYEYEPNGSKFKLTCLGKGNEVGGDKVPQKDLTFTEQGYVDDSAPTATK